MTPSTAPRPDVLLVTPTGVHLGTFVTSTDAELDVLAALDREEVRT